MYVVFFYNQRACPCPLPVWSDNYVKAFHLRQENCNNMRAVVTKQVPVIQVYFWCVFSTHHLQVRNRLCLCVGYVSYMLQHGSKRKEQGIEMWEICYLLKSLDLSSVHEIYVSVFLRLVCLYQSGAHVSVDKSKISQKNWQPSHNFSLQMLTGFVHQNKHPVSILVILPLVCVWLTWALRVGSVGPCFYRCNY